jgi:5-hydroxyisourate hydrolase
MDVHKLSLSTHILNISRGKPAENVKITLFKLINGNWIESKFPKFTNTDGRAKEFEKLEESVVGIYKLKFDIAEYFQTINCETLYPFIEVNCLKTNYSSHHNDYHYLFRFHLR